MRLLQAIAAFTVFGALLGACAANSDGGGFDPNASGGSGASKTGKGGGSGAGKSGSGGSGVGGGSASGGSLNSDAACDSISQTAQNGVRPVDIIFALDTSGSMATELAQVQNNMNFFANAIIQSGIDVHIVLIARPGTPTPSDPNADLGICLDAPLATGTCPGGSKPPAFQHVEDSVNSYDALDRLINLYPDYKKTLRQSAMKYFAVVSDDNALTTDDHGDPTGVTITSASAFAQAVQQLDAGWFTDWKFMGIFCTGSACTNACENTGTVYKDLVAQTSGVAGDLCGNNQNFQPVFDQMSQAIVTAKTVDCAWSIPPAPSGQTFQKDLVNVNYFQGGGGAAQAIYHVDSAADCGANGGWYYDDNANPTQILVCPSTCSTIQSDPSAQIDILFGCQTVDIPT